MPRVRQRAEAAKKKGNCKEMRTVSAAAAVGAIFGSDVRSTLICFAELCQRDATHVSPPPSPPPPVIHSSDGYRKLYYASHVACA